MVDVCATHTGCGGRRGGALLLGPHGGAGRASVAAAAPPADVPHARGGVAWDGGGAGHDRAWARAVHAVAAHSRDGRGPRGGVPCGGDRRIVVLVRIAVWRRDGLPSHGSSDGCVARAIGGRRGDAAPGCGKGDDAGLVSTVGPSLEPSELAADSAEDRRWFR